MPGPGIGQCPIANSQPTSTIYNTFPVNDVRLVRPTNDNRDDHHPTGAPRPGTDWLVSEAHMLLGTPLRHWPLQRLEPRGLLAQVG